LSKTLRALCLGVALVALMVACVGSILLNEIRRPADTDDTAIAFTVEPGDSTSTIATNLRREGLIRIPQLFTLLVRMQGFDGNLQAGNYLLRPNMTMSQIISALQIGIKIEEKEIVIVEGLRLEEIAAQIGAAGLSNVSESAFLAAARDGAAFKANHFHMGNLPENASL